MTIVSEMNLSILPEDVREVIISFVDPTYWEFFETLDGNNGKYDPMDKLSCNVCSVRRQFFSKEGVYFDVQHNVEYETFTSPNCVTSGGAFTEKPFYCCSIRCQRYSFRVAGDEIAREDEPFKSEMVRLLNEFNQLLPIINKCRHGCHDKGGECQHSYLYCQSIRVADDSDDDE